MLSHIASIARGSIAGINYTANSSSRIVTRSKPIPTRPHSNNQTILTASFGEASRRWNGLSTASLQGWEDYAKSLTFQGPIGKYKLPGRCVYMSNFCLSAYLHNRGFTAIPPSSTPPTELGFLTVDRLNISTPPSTGIGYRILGHNRQSHSILIAIWNSRSFESSRNHHIGPMKSNILFGGIVLQNAAFSFDITNLIEDKRYFCKIRAISVDAPLRLSQLYYFNTLAEEAPPGYVIPPLPPEEPL